MTEKIKNDHSHVEEGMMESILDLHSKLQDNIRTLEEEKKLMQEEMEQAERNKHFLMEHYQKELNEKNMRIRILEKQVIEWTLEYQRSNIHSREESKRTVQQLEYTHAKATEELNDQVAKVEIQLKELDDFRQEKEGLEKQKCGLEKSIQEMKHMHEQEISTRLQMESLDRTQLIEKMNSELDSVRQSASQLVAADMGKMLGHILKDHAELRKQIKRQMKLLNDLSKEKQEDEHSMTIFQSEIKLYKGRETKFLQQIRTLSQQNKVLKKEIKKGLILREAQNTKCLANNINIHENTNNPNNDSVAKVLPSNSSLDIKKYGEKKIFRWTKNLDSLAQNGKNEKLSCGETLSTNTNFSSRNSSFPYIIHKPNRLQRYLIKRGEKQNKAEEILINAIIQVMNIDHKKVGKFVPGYYNNINNPSLSPNSKGNASNRTQENSNSPNKINVRNINFLTLPPEDIKYVLQALFCFLSNNHNNKSATRNHSKGLQKVNTVPCNGIVRSMNNTNTTISTPSHILETKDK